STVSIAAALKASVNDAPCSTRRPKSSGPTRSTITNALEASAIIRAPPMIRPRRPPRSSQPPTKGTDKSALSGATAVAQPTSVAVAPNSITRNFGSSRKTEKQNPKQNWAHKSAANRGANSRGATSGGVGTCPSGRSIGVGVGTVDSAGVGPSHPIERTALVEPAFRCGEAARSVRSTREHDLRRQKPANALRMELATRRCHGPSIEPAPGIVKPHPGLHPTGGGGDRQRAGLRRGSLHRLRGLPRSADGHRNQKLPRQSLPRQRRGRVGGRQRRAMLGQQRVGVLPEQARSLLPLFLNRVASLPNPAANREACYFALLAHAWAHTCDRGHGTVEVI